MKSNATKVEQDLQQLPAHRRATISTMHQVVSANVPKGNVDGTGYGMIGQVVPRGLYRAGHHGDPKLPLPFVSLTSQQSHAPLTWDRLINSVHKVPDSS